MSKLTLLVQEAAGALRPATSEEILSAARAVLARTVRRGASLESPRAVREYLSVTLGNRPHEIFGVMYVDLCGPVAYVLDRRRSAVISDFSGV